MVWVQLFPTNATFVSNSVAQIQDNWLFLQTNINTDHFFNSVNPNNEGHHKYVQLLDQGIPAIAAGMSSVLFTLALGAANTEQPTWRNAVGLFYMPTYLTAPVAVAAPNVTQTLFNFAGLPRCSGIFTAHDPNASTNQGVGFYAWNGAALNIISIATQANITGFSVLGTALRITTNYNGFAVYTINILPY